MKSPLAPLTLCLLAGLARPAAAQLPPIRTPIPTSTNADVVYPPVSEHAPRAAALRTGGQNAMDLFAVTRSGLSHRQFVRVPGQADAGWANWVHRGSPSANAGAPEGWRRSLPVTGGWFGQGQDVLAFVDVPDNGSSEKVAVADLGTYAGAPPLPTSFSYALQSPGASTGGIPERFNPRTVLTSTASDHLDVFGTSDDVHAPDVLAPDRPLLRLHGTRTGASAWSFSATSLQRPPFSLNGASAQAAVGPQAGATFLLGSPAVPIHLVFVKAEFATEDHVTFVTGPTNGGAFTWGIDLGSPRPHEKIVDEPLALSYTWGPVGIGSFTRVCVFATAFDRTANRFGVFERHFDATPGASPTNAAAWTAWQPFGAPAGLGALTPFRLSTSVTWFQGSVLRINMFGHTDSDGSAPERMVELFWNGGSWQWGALRTPPNGSGIRATSAVVLQSTGYTRIAVFGRTGGDATFAGSATIWEMYWTEENGVGQDWTWRDLSWEPVIRRFP